MTFRQRLMKVLYPLIIKLSKDKATVLKNKDNVQPQSSVYDIPIVLNNGKQLSINELQGKKLMLVNTASDCGFTPQYKDLQQLYEKHKENLIIIGFPSNDFKEQEKSSDERIQQFCQVNFGVTFPLAKKTIVVNHPGQNAIFQWLSKKELNGWNTQQPKWNFSKYLINEKGMLTHYFDPAVSPLSTEVIVAINQKQQ